MNAATPAKRRRRDDGRNDQSTSFLPRNNRPARLAFIGVIVGLVPMIGLIAGWWAIAFGIQGWRLYKRNPDAKGGGHALSGIVLGSIEIVCNALALIFFGIALGWFERS